jgi:hypothetical protein
MGYRTRANPALRCAAAGFALILILTSAAPAARPAFRLGPPGPAAGGFRDLARSDSTYRHIFPVRDGEGGGNADEGGAEGSGRTAKILGSSLLVSGIFLCSWGISSWQVSEYQNCPAENTDNVIKIVVGIVLVNAGLIYLLGGND